mgnify:CR=1 FL=1
MIWMKTAAERRRLGRRVHMASSTRWPHAHTGEVDASAQGLYASSTAAVTPPPIAPARTISTMITIIIIQQQRCASGKHHSRGNY